MEQTNVVKPWSAFSFFFFRSFFLLSFFLSFFFLFSFFFFLSFFFLSSFFLSSFFFFISVFLSFFFRSFFFLSFFFLSYFFLLSFLFLSSFFFLSFFFLPFLFWPLLPTHNSCRGSLLLLMTLNDTPHSVGLLWTRDRPKAETSTWQHTHSQQTNIHATGGIRTHDRSRRAAVDLRLRPGGYWDRHTLLI